MTDRFAAPHELTLVVGGTGKTGRRVVERLRTRDVPVRVGSRSGQPRFDWEDRATWAPALRGATSAYVTFYPDLAIPGTAQTISAFAEQALDAGTRRLVLLSGRGEPEAMRAERALQESGADWTIVRCSFFAQNFSESFFLDPVLAGEFVFPAAEVTEPFIDADDIADVAVAALTEPGHAEQLYEVTGPRLLTFADACQEIARASGRELRYVPVSLETYVEALEQQGLPDDFIDALRHVASEVLDGRSSSLTDGVQRALGREPTDFADYARRTAATGIWNATPAHATRTELTTYPARA